MSQLRNLLTNKVIKSRIGTSGLSAMRKSRKASGVRAARMRSEIAERRIPAASQRQPEPKSAPRFFSRIYDAISRSANAFRRVANA